jgi:AraC-like DNA-binding protein
MTKALGTNRHYVERAVHVGVGVTFKIFRTQKRLAYVQALQKQGLLVKQIAAKVGYRSPDAFSRFFKSETGNSPKRIKVNTSLHACGK